MLKQHHPRLRSSGLDVEQLGTKGAEVFDLRDGKVTRLVSTGIATAPSPTSGWLRRKPR